MKKLAIWAYDRTIGEAIQHKTEFDIGCVEKKVWTARLALYLNPPYPIAAKIYFLLTVNSQMQKLHIHIRQLHTAA